MVESVESTYTDTQQCGEEHPIFRVCCAISASLAMAFSRLRHFGFFIFGATSVLAACATDEVSDDLMEEVPDEVQSQQIPKAKGALSFAHGCDQGVEMVLSGLGDVLLHTPLQNQAKARDNNPNNDDYESLWEKVQPLVGAADISYANFEGPADGSKPGSSYPAFNYSPTLIPALKRLGVDVVSTANNHALDKGFAGAKATIDALEAHLMPYSGTSRGGDPKNYSWSAQTVTDKNGVSFKLAWLACSFAQNSATGATNGINDSNKAVLNCERDKDFVLARISELASSYDAVIVTPHWGLEYELSPRPAQKAMAQAFVDAGARVIIGNHPHVPQSWDKLVSAKDGRDAFVAYSLGNFISNQLPGVIKSAYSYRTLAAHVGLVRTADGKTEISGVRFTPLYARKRAGRIGVVPALSEAEVDELAKATVSTTDIMFDAAHRVAQTPTSTRGIWSQSAGFACPSE